MKTTASQVAALSGDQRRKLELLLLEFDRDWTVSDLVVQVNDLPADSEAFREAAVLELACIDLERQWKSGLRPAVEDYLLRYTELGTPRTVAAELLFAEYEARQIVGESVRLRDFQLRFPERFEPFRQLVENAVRLNPDPTSSIDTSQEGEVTDTRTDGIPTRSSLPTEFGRYRVLKQLGEGGMGSVYLARDTELDRQVALKIPKFEGGENKQMLDRFYREARAAAKLRHTNICPVYDVGELSGVHYISMAHIEGRPLSAYVRGGYLQSQRQAVLVVRKLAMALNEAHSQGIVHRDLKPANIMIDRSKEPVIMDFGLAGQLDRQQKSRLTQQGMVIGSPAYMSPEQVAGDVALFGPATDIYSLGVILFELLTGRVPFEGPVTAVLGQIMTQQAPSPSIFRTDLDPRVIGICERMMARQIEDRFDSMKDVANALTDYVKTSQDKPADQDSPPQDQIDSLKKSESAATFSAEQLPLPQRVSVARHRTRDFIVSSLSIAKRLPPRAIWIATGAAVIISLLLMGVLLMLPTPHGTLKVEIEDPNLNFAVDGTNYTIAQLDQPQDLSAGDHPFAVAIGGQHIPLGKTVSLRTANYNGQYRLSVKLDGIELTSNRFRIFKNKKQVLVVVLDNGTVPQQQHKQPDTATPDTPPNANAQRKSERERAEQDAAAHGTDENPPVTDEGVHSDTHEHTAIQVPSGTWTKILYSENDFNNYWSSTKSGGTAVYENGELMLRVDDTNTGGVDCSIADPGNTTDIVLRAKIKMLKGQHAALVLYSRNLMAYFHGREYGQFGLERWESNNEPNHNFGSTRLPQYANMYEDYVEMSVALIDDTLILFVDGVEILRGKDRKPDKWNAVGLSVCKGGHPHATAFIKDVDVLIPTKAQAEMYLDGTSSPRR